MADPDAFARYYPLPLDLQQAQQGRGFLEAIRQNPLMRIWGDPGAVAPAESPAKKEAAKGTYTAPSSIKAQQELAQRMRPSNVSEAAALSGSKGLRAAGAATDFGTAFMPYMMAKQAMDKEAANNAITQEITQRMLAADPAGRAAILGASPDSAQRNIAVEMQLKADEERRAEQRQIEQEKRGIANAIELERQREELSNQSFDRFFSGGSAPTRPVNAPVQPSVPSGVPGVALDPGAPAPPPAAAAAPAPPPAPSPAPSPAPTAPQAAAPPPAPKTREEWNRFYASRTDPLERLALQTAFRKRDVGDLLKLHEKMTNPNKVMEDAAQKELGEAQGKARANLPLAMHEGGRILHHLDDILKDKRLDKAIGWWDGIRWIPTLGEGTRGVEAKLDQLEGDVFVQAYNSLRGAGSITEQESKPAKEALARIVNRRQSETDYRKALNDFRDEVTLLMDLNHAKANVTSPQDLAAKAAEIRGRRDAEQKQKEEGATIKSNPKAFSGATELRWNPQTGKLEPVK